jgi:hypothetical protein
MAESKSLRLGNVFNKVGALGANTEEKSARSLALANTLTGVADTLSGKDFQPGMSGFEQTLIAGVRGAASGLQGKAAIEKAKGQDELNAFAKSLADSEMAAAEAEQYQSKINQANEQSAVPYAASRVALVEGTMQLPEYTTAVSNLIRSNVEFRGEELVTEPAMEGNDPDTWGWQVRDPETGKISTVKINLARELTQHVLKQDAELGRALAMAQGRLPKGFLDKTKEPTGKLADLQAAQQALGRELTEPERMKILGLSDGKEAPRGSFILGEEGEKEAQKKRQAVMAGSAERAAARGAIQQVQELLAADTQTGALTELSANALGALGTILGVDFTSVTNVSQLNSLLKSQLRGVLSIFGAGTGISNRDVDNAQLIIGTVNNPKDALRKIQAYADAQLTVTDEYAKFMRELDLALQNGQMSEADGRAALFEFENTMFDKLKQRYAQSLDSALSMEQNFMRTGSTTGATPQAAPAGEITIDIDGNIIQ